MEKRFVMIVVIAVFVALTATAFVACDLTKDDPVDLSGKGIAIDFKGKEQFEYTGQPITPDFNILDGYNIIEEFIYGVANDNIVVEYSDNTGVGTATVTVTPGNSGKYTGKAVTSFEIVASSQKVEVTDFESLKESLNGGKYGQVVVGADITVPEGESIEVGKGVKLNMGGHALINNGTVENNGEINFDEGGEGNSFVNGGMFKNYGKILFYAPGTNAEAFVNGGDIENAGEIYLNGNKEGALCAENSGDFKNDGTVYINTYADFYNCGGFENIGYVRASGEAKFYTNSDISGNRFTALVRRYPIEEFEISLSDDKFEYSGAEIKPTPHFYKEGVAVDYGDYELFYENNVNAGTATVKIVAIKDSEAFYGEATLTFGIEKGSVTVTDAEGFYNALSNPNYDTINLNTDDRFGTLLDEGFTVPEGLTLNISAASDEGFRGNVVNNGRIVVLKGYGLRVYGMLENNGEMSVKHIVNRGTVDNNGTISLGKGKSYSGNLTNAGVITIAERGTFYAGGDTDDKKEFVNDGKVDSLGTVYVNHTLTNNGTFENKGELFVFTAGSVKATEQIINDGSVYLNEASDAFGGSGSVKVKSEIQQSDVEITNLPFVYDGEQKEATVRIEGGDSRYDVTYKQGVTETDCPLNAGSYELTVTFREDSRAFKGSATIAFTVERGETTVNTYDALIAALDNYNYSRVVFNAKYINGDLQIPQGYVLVIPEDKTLINNGHGIEVNGSVENNGSYSNESITSALTVNDGGTFINNGTSYFNDYVPAGVSGDGTVYLREDIASATILTLTKTQVVYCMENGYIKTETPGFTLTTVQGEAVNVGEYRSFCTNDREISTEGDLAKLTVRASSTSTKYYGETSAEYTVLRGETTVSAFDELKEALGNIKAGTELCNFGTITLTADISAGEIKKDVTLTIASNCTLVIANHNLDLYNEDHITENLYIVNKGKIEIYGGAFSYVGSRYNDDGGGRIIGYAANAADFARYARSCDEVRLTADIDEEISLFTNSVYDGECVIDTCGYDIKRIVVQMQGRRSFTIKSSVSGSVIGGEQYTDSGIYCQEIDEKATLTLVNLTVYGIEYNYLASENRVFIDESCNIIS